MGTKLKRMSKFGESQMQLDRMNDQMQVQLKQLEEQYNRPSQETLDLKNQLDSIRKPEEYNSQYQNEIDALIQKINNREPFSYDFNQDSVYQQYKDIYQKLGNEASMNAVANASSMTGGYGNSYATTAAAQANQQYMSRMNDVIPELAQAALDRYNSETDKLYQQYAMYGDQEDRAYEKYRDTLNDYYTNRDYITGRYDAARNMDYQKYQDALDAWRNERDYTYGQFVDNRNYDYQRSRDEVSDSQWQQQMDYQKDRDAVSD